MMKRAIIAMELPPITQFELEIQEPGIIHNFTIAFRKPKILSAPGGPEIEEVPTILVEINPDAFKKKRKFAVIPLGQVLEAEKFEYRGTTLSRSGAVFSLFEDTSLS